MIGTTIGNYRIDDKLGEGGVGLVWKATDLTLDRPVALKVLRSEFASRPGVVERFRTEALLLARLNHPNVATLHSFLCEEDLLVMVMEYVQGQTFEQMIRSFGPMRFARALPLFFQALDGIEYAHDHAIVHRDVKGSNVMLNHLGVVKVMDFGIARVVGSARVTQSEHRIGTPAWMSPEQIRGEEADARSDVYALGLLLYLLLTGRAPFAAKSDYELCRMHLEEAPAPPRSLVPDLPESIERSVMRALAKGRDERFASVADLRASLTAGFVPSATPPLGFAGVGVKRTVLLPDGVAPFPSRGIAQTVEFTDVDGSAPASEEAPTAPRSLPHAVRGAVADDDPEVETIRIETLPQPPRRRTAALLWRIAAAGALALLLLLGARAAWVRYGTPRPTVPWPPLVEAPETAGREVVDVPLGAPPAAAPAEVVMEPASQAEAAPPAATPQPKPPSVASKERKARVAREARRRAAQQAAARPEPAPPPAARDESQEEGWVIRRR